MAGARTVLPGPRARPEKRGSDCRRSDRSRHRGGVRVAPARVATWRDRTGGRRGRRGDICWAGDGGRRGRRVRGLRGRLRGWRGGWRSEHRAREHQLGSDARRVHAFGGEWRKRGAGRRRASGPAGGNKGQAAGNGLPRRVWRKWRNRRWWRGRSGRELVDISRIPGPRRRRTGRR